MNRQPDDGADLGIDYERNRMEHILSQRLPPNPTQTLEEYRAWPVDPFLPDFGNSGPRHPRRELPGGVVFQADPVVSTAHLEAQKPSRTYHLQHQQSAAGIPFGRTRDRDQAQMQLPPERLLRAAPVQNRSRGTRVTSARKNVGSSTRNMAGEAMNRVPEPGNGRRKKRGMHEQRGGPERGDRSREGKEETVEQSGERFVVRIPGMIWNDYGGS
jgi:hypothetical protein